MIELGLVQSIQSDSTVAALAPVGGFFAQLPENQALPAWVYNTISESVDYLLAGPDSLVERRVQIDCYGTTAAEAIALAAAIDRLLTGWRGTLPDPDATRVAGLFRSNLIDFFDQSARTFRRLLEYSVWFYQA